MMYASSNPDGTTYYYYDAYDRVEHMTDPRWNTTFFQYDARGKTIRITHADSSFIQTAYNNDGTVASVTDELGHTTSYTYDEYKRALTVTNPLSQTTTISYALDWANPLVHTTQSVKYIVSPMNKNIVFDYDANFRKIDQVAALGTADEAWTLFEYDAVGNLTKTTDPRWNAATFGYDNRNRRTTATDPHPFDNQVTHWDYDATNNLRFLTRPDGSRREWQYDSMNRVIDSYGFANEHTHYDRDLPGNVWRMIDAKNAAYSFGYDSMNRKASATYPTDATATNRTEVWSYTTGGVLDYYKNPANQYQHFHYDSRNRRDHSWWDGGVGPDIVTGYDFASRVSSVVTNSDETTVAFGYNDANRKIWEDQTLSGYPTRRVNTPPDADGNRMSLDVANYYHIDYGFNQRNQLSAIGSFANFHYDANGNMTNQERVWGYTNETNFAYDELNRVTQTELGANGWIYARSHYQYDSLGRQIGTWRDEQSSKGEHFWYTAEGQLWIAEYNADQAWTGSPTNWDRWVGYTYTGDTLNRQSVNDNGTVTGYNPDAINQYTTVGGQAVGYDANFNLNSWGGATVTYDAQNEMTSLNNGNTAQFTYDGLGRCVRRTINGVPRLFTYDGWKPMLEWDQWGNFLAWNVYGAGPDEILVRGDSTYGTLIYKQDHHGNVVGLLDGGGNVIEKYTYDAFGQPTATDYWGNVRGSTSWYGNRFLFQGREWIAELGIYDYRNRYYHPALGRFLQSDPTGFDAGDANLFRFCGGDPVNGSDPFGLQEPDMNGQGEGWTDGVNVNTTEIPPEIGKNPFADDKPWDLWTSVRPLDSYFDSSSPFGNEQFRVDNNPGPAAPSIVDPSQVRMIDQEDSFSPSEWSDHSYTLDWSLTNNGATVSSGTINGITPRQAYRRTSQVGFATATGMIPGQSVTYSFVTRTSAGFVYNGWSVTATVIDPWGIQSGSLQSRLNLQTQGTIPMGINLRQGGGLSSFLYGQLPASTQYNGYYYAVPGGH